MFLNFDEFHQRVLRRIAWLKNRLLLRCQLQAETIQIEDHFTNGREVSNLLLVHVPTNTDVGVEHVMRQGHHMVHLHGVHVVVAQNHPATGAQNTVDRLDERVASRRWTVVNANVVT